MTNRWRRYAAFYAGSGGWVLLAIFVAVLELGLVVPVPVLIRTLFDDAIRNRRIDRIVEIVIVLGVLRLLSTASSLLLRKLSLDTTKLAIQRMRRALLEKLYGVPYAWLQRSDPAALHTTIVQETERVDVMSNALVALLIPSALTTGALAAILLWVSPPLFLIVATSAPVLYAVHRLLAGRMRDLTDRFRRAFERFSSGVLFALRTMDLARASAAERGEMARQDGAMSALRETSGRMAWLQSAYGAIQTLVVSLVMLVVLAAGGVMVSRGQSSLGDLASFYVAAVLFAGAMNTFWSALPTVFAGNRSLGNIDDFLQLSLHPPYSGRERFNFRGGVRMANVRFGYDDISLLDGIDLDIGPGDFVALHGPNGAGKTTIVHLLLGWQRPDSGNLLADNRPYEAILLNDLLSRIGLLPQDPVIFAGTVSENVAYGRADVLDGAVVKALETVGGEDLLARLPAGVATLIGNEGHTLSGGERQRIGLARALIHQPALLILDEPTNHLDTGEFVATLRNIRNASPQMSVLIVSHDQPVIEEADTVYMLEGGALSRRLTSRRAISSTGEHTVALAR